MPEGGKAPLPPPPRSGDHGNTCVLVRVLAGGPGSLRGQTQVHDTCRGRLTCPRHSQAWERAPLALGSPTHASLWAVRDFAGPVWLWKAEVVGAALVLLGTLTFWVILGRAAQYLAPSTVDTHELTFGSCWRWGSWLCVSLTWVCGVYFLARAVQSRRPSGAARRSRHGVVVGSHPSGAASALGPGLLSVPWTLGKQHVLEHSPLRSGVVSRRPRSCGARVSQATSRLAAASSLPTGLC